MAVNIGDKCPIILLRRIDEVCGLPMEERAFPDSNDKRGALSGRMQTRCEAKKSSRGANVQRSEILSHQKPKTRINRKPKTRCSRPPETLFRRERETWLRRKQETLCGQKPEMPHAPKSKKRSNWGSKNNKEPKNSNSAPEVISQAIVAAKGRQTQNLPDTSRELEVWLTVNIKIRNVENENVIEDLTISVQKAFIRDLMNIVRREGGIARKVTRELMASPPNSCHESVIGHDDGTESHDSHTSQELCAYDDKSILKVVKIERAESDGANTRNYSEAGNLDQSTSHDNCLDVDTRNNSNAHDRSDDNMENDLEAGIRFDIDKNVGNHLPRNRFNDNNGNYSEADNRPDDNTRNHSQVKNHPDADAHNRNYFKSKEHSQNLNGTLSEAEHQTQNNTRNYSKAKYRSDDSAKKFSEAENQYDENVRNNCDVINLSDDDAASPSCINVFRFHYSGRKRSPTGETANERYLSKGNTENNSEKGENDFDRVERLPPYHAPENQASVQSDSKKTHSDSNAGSPSAKHDSAEKSECLAKPSDEASTSADCPIKSKQKRKDLQIFPPKKSSTWSQCLAKCNEHSNQRKHLATYVRGKPYACELCPASFRTMCFLSSHLKNHSAERPHACPHCSAKFKNQTTLKRHLTTHSSVRLYTCAHCSATFKNKKHLEYHISTHSSDTTYSCQYCPAKFELAAQLKRHLLLHSSELCPENNDPENLLIHPEKKWACGQCSAKFMTKTTLVNHLATHSNEKPYSCSRCSAKFKLRGKLNEHANTHAPEKLHACNQCPAKFKTSSILKRHLATHSSDTPYVCPHCPAKCKFYSNFRRHLLIHSKVLMHACSQCTAKFKRKIDARHHLELHPENDRAHVVQVQVNLN